MQQGIGTVVPPCTLREKVDSLWKLQLACEIRPAVTSAELSDDDHVVEDCIRRQTAFPELDDKVVQLLVRNLLQLPASKVFVKARQHCVVLAVGIGLFQGFDLIASCQCRRVSTAGGPYG